MRIHAAASFPAGEHTNGTKMIRYESGLDKAFKMHSHQIIIIIIIP